MKDHYGASEMPPMDNPAPQRQLRRRDTPKAPYRPRPALTSSARGKSNAEARRERELAANAAFIAANALAESTLLPSRSGRKSTTPASSRDDGLGSRVSPSAKSMLSSSQGYERSLEELQAHSNVSESPSGGFGHEKAATETQREKLKICAAGSAATTQQQISKMGYQEVQMDSRHALAPDLTIRRNFIGGRSTETLPSSHEGHRRQEFHEFEIAQDDDKGQRKLAGALRGSECTKTQLIHCSDATDPLMSIYANDKQEISRMSEETEMADTTLLNEEEKKEDDAPMQMDAGDETLVGSQLEGEASPTKKPVATKNMLASMLDSKIVTVQLDDGVHNDVDVNIDTARSPSIAPKKDLVDGEESDQKIRSVAKPKDSESDKRATDPMEVNEEMLCSNQEVLIKDAHEVMRKSTEFPRDEPSGQSLKRGREGLCSASPPSKAARLSLSDDEFGCDDDFLEQLADYELSLDESSLRAKTSPPSPHSSQALGPDGEAENDLGAQEPKPPATDGFVWGRGQAVKKPDADALLRWGKLFDEKTTMLPDLERSDNAAVTTTDKRERSCNHIAARPLSPQQTSAASFFRAPLPNTPNPNVSSCSRASGSRPPFTPLQLNEPTIDLNSEKLGSADRMNERDEMQVLRPSFQRPWTITHMTGVVTPAPKAPAAAHSPATVGEEIGLRRTPARLGSRGRYSSPMATGQASKTIAQALGTNATSTPIRLSFASTPRRSFGFKTPFKKINSPARAFEEDSPSKSAMVNRFTVPLANAKPRATVTDGSTSHCAGNSSTLVSHHSPGHKPVFALFCDTQRKSLRDYPLSPEDEDVSAWMRDANAPEEFRMILNGLADPARFHFEESGVAKGPKALCKLLNALGPIEIGKRWVDNHYRLILWKLAALVRASPAEGWRFSWMEVCRQMRYRYEREVNCSHRSAIKRIQERDSAAGRPMVLCVYKLPQSVSFESLEIKGNEDQEKRMSEDLTPLELTDGWYIIKSMFDDPILRAIKRGKIKRGSKMAIFGAKLVSDSEAKDVLDALNSASLRITGNGSKLARWDARLGFTKQPFVSTIRSLNGDGGLVPMMHLVATRIYPMAYIEEEMLKELRHAHNEEDEYRLESRWKEEREAARQSLKREKGEDVRRIERVVHVLEDELESLEDKIVVSASAEECEGILDAMLEASSPRSYIKLSHTIPTLTTLAHERLHRALDAYENELEQEIDKICPPRKVRSFRLVRFRDVQPCDNTIRHSFRVEEDVKGLSQSPPLSLGQGLSKKRAACRRSLLLHIWDIDKMSGGKDALALGHKYRVTNLIPTQKGAWMGGPDTETDVYLATTRDTSWGKLP